MKDKYTPGQDCGCYAYSESECGCDADWTPTEVYELRQQLKSERALADSLARFIDSIVNAEGPYPYLNETSIIPAAYAELKAWKEARSE